MTNEKTTTNANEIAQSAIILAHAKKSKFTIIKENTEKLRKMLTDEATEKMTHKALLDLFSNNTEFNRSVFCQFIEHFLHELPRFSDCTVIAQKYKECTPESNMNILYFYCQTFPKEKEFFIMYEDYNTYEENCENFVRILKKCEIN